MGAFSSSSRVEEGAWCDFFDGAEKTIKEEVAKLPDGVGEDAEAEEEPAAGEKKEAAGEPPAEAQREAALTIRKCIQKVRVAKIENYDQVKAEFKIVLAQELDSTGPHKTILKNESVKAME